MSNKYLINAQHGADDVEKATVAMIIAGASASMDGETAMFLTCESVRLATKDGTNGLQADGYPALADLLKSYLENGGQIWVCPVCAKARGITAENLIDGAELSGAARTIGFVGDGAKTLM